MVTGASDAHRDLLQAIGWSVLLAGVPALVVATALDPSAARSAAEQDWPPFVLVTGLLALGLVAGRDGLFEAGGAFIARLGRGGFSLLASAAALVSVVTAVLNLDTSVAFLTPVLVVAARRRRTGEAPFLYLSVFLANGASLLLPGSNLTNLIVLGTSGPSGGAFAARMFPAFVASVLCITVVLGVVFARSLSGARGEPPGAVGFRPRLSSAGVAASVVAMLILPAGMAAVVVLAVGSVLAVHSLRRARISTTELRRAVNLPILIGLFSVATVMGVVGRVWAAPGELVAHAAGWQAAVTGAAASLVVNNLPAASLLAARPVHDPFALLVGLNLGPNLFVTGALSAVLWIQVARPLGAHPSATRFARLGAVVTPLSMAAALGALALFG